MGEERIVFVPKCLKCKYILTKLFLSSSRDTFVSLNNLLFYLTEVTILVQMWRHLKKKEGTCQGPMGGASLEAGESNMGATQPVFY